MLRQATEALDRGDVGAGTNLLVDLATIHGDVLVPLADAGAYGPADAEPGLRWPARRVANAMLALLPPKPRHELVTRWGADAEALWRRGAQGDHAAWEALAERYGALDLGARAMRILGELALERGDLVQGAEYLGRWLRWHGHRHIEARPRVAGRLVDALARLEDVGGLAGLQREAVAWVGAGEALVERITEAQLARPPARERLPAGEVDPGELRLLWDLELPDEGRVEAPGAIEHADIRHGVLLDEGRLVVHAHRTVRCLELPSGRERWRFPREPGNLGHALSVRYWPHDRPCRTVTRAGDLLLVVLGAPPADGAYEFMRSSYGPQGLGAQPRTRLVALDRETGALVWATGRATERDALLGSQDVGCTSPPLVVGERVYATFGRMSGAGSLHLVCLERATGAVRWRTALAAGGSGRAPDRTRLGRFASSRLQALPWGARPSLANGEVAVVPHAGFAAGVDAETGAPRWLRALPRFPLGIGTAFVDERPSGHGGRNAPVAVGDAWILAPLDCPDLLCIEQRTGRLRWRRSSHALGDANAIGGRHVLGLARTPDGSLRLRMDGEVPVEVGVADGAVHGRDHLVPWSQPGDAPPGPMGQTYGDIHRFHRAAVWRGGMLQVQPWRPGRDPDATVLTQRSVPDAVVPREGHLLHGGLWVVVGDQRLSVLIREDSLWSLREEPEEGIAPRDRLDELVFDVARGEVGDALSHPIWQEPALRRDMPTVRVLAAALTRLLDRGRRADLEHLSRSLETVDGVVRRARQLDPATRDRLHLDAAEALYELGRPERTFELVTELLARGAHDTVEMPGTSPWHWRADLRAAALLQELAPEPTLEARFETWRVEAREALAAAPDAAALRRLVRTFPGTDAAATARERLAAAAREAGRLDEAAGWWADLRMDPPWSLDGRPPERRRRQLAAWGLAEVAARVAAHDADEARNLLEDLARWAPPGVEVEGRSLGTWRQAAVERFAWHPVREAHAAGTRGHAVWPEDEPPTRDEIRGVRWLGLRGPGVAAWTDRSLLVRGLDLEVWSWPDAKRLAELPAPDHGWFGGSLRAVPRWLPEGGIRVASVVAGEPADRAGVRAGDWILGWDGAPLRDLASFMQAIARGQPGKAFDVDVRRGGASSLERFAAGRRPTGQGTLLSYDPLWVAEDGRVLLPSRSGLSWIHPDPLRREMAWRWDGTGLVLRAQVVGERVYVHVRRRLQPDAIVALDLPDLREAWRRDVEGVAMAVRPTGSAVVVHARHPEAAWVLDRRDGSVRARHRTAPVRLDEYRHVWVDTRSSAAACGRLYALVEGPRTRERPRRRLRVVDTTTGGLVGVDASLPVRRVSGGEQVAAGAFGVATRSAYELVWAVPGPSGRDPVRWLRMNRNHILADQSHHGILNGDTRLYLMGRHLMLLRLPYRGTQKVSVSVFQLDEEALGALPAGDGVVDAGPAIVLTNAQFFLGGQRDDRYVLEVRPTFEGLLTTAAHLDQRHVVEVYWTAVPPDDAATGVRAENRSRSLLYGSTRDARRHAPVVVGDRLVVPTDVARACCAPYAEAGLHRSGGPRPPEPGYSVRRSTTSWGSSLAMICERTSASLSRRLICASSSR